MSKIFHFISFQPDRPIPKVSRIMSLPEQQDPESVGQAQSKELEFVHSVYEEIASHFLIHVTRYIAVI